MNSSTLGRGTNIAGVVLIVGATSINPHPGPAPVASNNFSKSLSCFLEKVGEDIFLAEMEQDLKDFDKSTMVKLSNLDDYRRFFSEE